MQASCYPIRTSLQKGNFSVKKLGVFVDNHDNWLFFEEIFEDLASQYEVEVYKVKSYNVPLLSARINRWAQQEELRSILRRNDVCFFEWSGELLAYASHMPKSCSIVTRLHSHELYSYAPDVNWQAVDRVILLSEAMRKRFVELYPDCGDKTEVVHNGRPLDKFKPPNPREFSFNLGMLCNIVPVKRIYEAILTLNEIREQGYPAKLHVAGEPRGDFRYASAVYDVVERLGLKESVIFHDYVTDTAAWLQQIDIFISNSYWEGQQVALIEAMATGCYCLSHFWAGVEEILPPENVYVTENELREKIVAYSELSDAEKNHLQRKIRSIACEKFDIERIKPQIRQIVKKMEMNGAFPQ
jgi:glycosyltransferase involved in cell wall biosynthesis